MLATLKSLCDYSHICTQCSKSITELDTLKRHMPSHNGKPKKCSQCDKSFTMLATLKTYLIIYSGGKLHKCAQCGKPFTLVDTLKIM